MRRYIVGGIVLVGMLLLSFGVCCGKVHAAERDWPVQIGVLASGWGPNPQSVGLRDGLLELGYRENEHFVLGIRFVQGNRAALPTAGRELIQFGADLLCVEDLTAQEAPQVPARLSLVFAGPGDPPRP